MDKAESKSANIIPWSSPVPSFGSVSSARVATLGLNPSNKEFVDALGRELDGTDRRFHTLKSLNLARWTEAKDQHVRLIEDSCSTYFQRSPYDGWFRRLDKVISGTGASYYNSRASACHLDLIPYATASKWTALSTSQRSTLAKLAGNTLGELLRDSALRVLVLNGAAVVKAFQGMSGEQLEPREIESWALRRSLGSRVPGISYKGVVDSVCGVRLHHKILVLGYNHNIQSSFGVTTEVTMSIRSWIAKHSTKALS